MKKVLIVDDSLVYRHALTSALSEDKKFVIVGTAKNGQEALEYIAKNPVDIITLDIEMPIMNGFELIEKISKFPSKPKIIVFTSLDQSGADNAFRALKMGADDFLTKLEGSSGDINKNINEIKKLLIPKMEALLALTPTVQVSITPTLSTIPEPLNKKLNPLRTKYEYILIGASTGGPEALRTLFKDLRGSRLPPILIVQHMPPIYTQHLAKTLGEFTDYKVVEAKNGDPVRPGYCYIAPGDYHMVLNIKEEDRVSIQLNQEEKDCYVRPAVNCLFRSSAKIAQDSLYIVLTGMGSDGLDGVKTVYNYNKNMNVLIQDEKSSVVFGMPGELFKNNLYSDVKNLNDIRDYLINIIK